MIGPTSSNLVSEIILTRIDEKLIDKKHRFIRFIDDYECYADSYEDAKRFIADLRKVLAEYDLSINEKKTQIFQIGEYVENDLPFRMFQLNYLLRYQEPYNKITYKQLVSYFDALKKTCTDLGSNLSVYSYAFKMLSEEEMSINASRFYIDEAMALSLNNPYLLSYVKSFVFDKFGVTENISDYCAKLYNSGVEEANYEKAIYGLYFAIVYQVKILSDVENSLFENANRSGDCIFRLISSIYCKQYDLSTEEFYNLAKELESDDVEIDRNWLFIYETLNEEDLRGEWKTIKKAKISFIKKEVFKPIRHWKESLY